MPKATPITIRPAVSSNWPDLESLMESRGAPHHCWCMAWRENQFKTSNPGKPGKKQALRARVDQAIPIGLLAYENQQPIAWCSIAPKSTYRRLSGEKVTGNDVWSIVCFFIPRAHRGRGLTAMLIDAAADCARTNGAQWLEAYGVDPSSPSYRFMGFKSTYERAGFQQVGTIGARRSIMRLKL